MSFHSNPVPLQLSALQLAWMHELGIEKPWIPAAAPVITMPVASVPGSAMTNVDPSVVATSVSATSSLSSPVSLGDRPAMPSALGPARPATRPAARPSGASSARGAKASTPEVATVVRGGAAETTRIAAAAQTLEALAEGIASCQACGLCMERERVVVGQGVLQAAVMVVGEGPGEQEDRQGEPFVGRSGMLLDNMLSAIDSSREKNVYVANIIKCRPPGNRSPRPEEIAACQPFLLRQIDLVSPKSILALGKPAAQSLLGVDAPLSAMREQAYTLPHPGHMVPVVVSYHPAYLLRKSTEKAAAWKDLNQVRALIQAMA